MTTIMDRRTKYAGQGYNVVKNKDVQLDVNLDIYTLDVMCRYIMSDNYSVRRGQLINLRNLIFLLNPDAYNNDMEKSKRVSFIKKGLEARINFNLTSPVMITKHINGGILDTDILDVRDFQELSNSEANWLSNMVSEALKFSKMDNYVTKMMDVCSRFKATDYGSKSGILNEFEILNAEVQNSFRKVRNESQSEMTFSLVPGEFENTMYTIHNKLSSPSRRLMCGMQGMNELLGGGFESTRVYVFLALPGEGKTTTILNLIKQIKKSNKRFKTKDPTKTPCVVLLTMENSVVENVSTLFSICTDNKNLTNFTAEDAINILKTEGELYLSDDSPINIVIKYVPNMSVDTSYLYTITEDLEDEGMEVVAFFQDYIGRIRSVDQTSDSRIDIGNVVNELKVFATIKDIPVITASQLNRDASKHIDEGRKANKADLIRMLGRSNISESMLILNNADGVFIIAPEWTTDGGKYLGIQRVKNRYLASNRQYIYLPYDNMESIDLMEDLNLPTPLFKSTLRSDDPDFGSGPRQSAYHTNRIGMLDQGFKDDGEHNIFKHSASIVSSNPAIEYREQATMNPINWVRTVSPINWH